MTTYRVAAVDRDTGETVTLSIPAQSPEEAERKAQEQGWLVTKVGYGSPSPRPRIQAASDPAPPVVIQSPLLSQPVRTIAAGVLVGHLAIAGLVVAFWVFASIVGVFHDEFWGR